MGRGKPPIWVPAYLGTSETRRKNRAPDNGPEAAREIAKERKNSEGEGLLFVSLYHVDSPDAKARLKRALRLILKATQGDETSVRTEIPQK